MLEVASVILHAPVDLRSLGGNFRPVSWSKRGTMREWKRKGEEKMLWELQRKAMENEAKVHLLLHVIE